MGNLSTRNVERFPIVVQQAGLACANLSYIAKIMRQPSQLLAWAYDVFVSLWVANTQCHFL